MSFYRWLMLFFALIAISASIYGAFIISRWLGCFALSAWALLLACASLSCDKDEAKKKQ